MRDVREIEDRDGVRWRVGVLDRSGKDYKGRFVFTARPMDGESGEVVLDDLRWNSEKTARRTLETMSPVELDRRIAWALGRAAPHVPGGPR